MATSVNEVEENTSAETVGYYCSETICRSPTIITTSTTRSWKEDGPFLRIVEQPHPTRYRFRYKSEGRLAGSIPGINSTDITKTAPTIEIVNYTGSLEVLVSCVTVDEPYQQHPHLLVSKNPTKGGVYSIQIKGPPMLAVLENVGIRWIPKDGIEDSLKHRKKVNFDPFGAGFDFKNRPLNSSAVRLCFEGRIPSGHNTYQKLPPVVSDPITNKKHVYELAITRLCSCSDKASGGTEILMFCNPLLNDNIRIRFYEESNNRIIWEELAKFQKTDIHQKCGIAFRTPPYRDVNIEAPVKVLIQIVKIPTIPSTSVQRMLISSQYSEPRPFTYYPDPGRHRRQPLEGRVQRMSNWIRSINNSESVLNDETREPQPSQDRMIISASGQEQTHNKCSYNYNIMASASNQYAPVKNLLNSEYQKDYQKYLFPVLNNETREPQPSQDQMVISASGQEQTHNRCSYDNNTMATASNQYAPVENLLNSEFQKDFQLQQLLQIWQPQEPQPKYDESTTEYNSMNLQSQNPHFSHKLPQQNQQQKPLDFGQAMDTDENTSLQQLLELYMQQYPYYNCN